MSLNKNNTHIFFKLLFSVLKMFLGVLKKSQNIKYVYVFLTFFILTHSFSQDKNQIIQDTTYTQKLN